MTTGKHSRNGHTTIRSVSRRGGKAGTSQTRGHHDGVRQGQTDSWGISERDALGLSPSYRETSPRSSTRSLYIPPHPVREDLKPILDELKDQIERIKGEWTLDDRRWLRHQLRRLANSFPAD